MFFAAAAAHLPDDPTPQDVYDGLNQIRNDDLGGLTYPLTFTAGQPSARKVCWNLLVIKNKAYTPFSGSAQQCR
jgi:branched-chain amino acid transport system substrate-binding protein